MRNGLAFVAGLIFVAGLVTQLAGHHSLGCQYAVCSLGTAFVASLLLALFAHYRKEHWKKNGEAHFKDLWDASIYRTDLKHSKAVWEERRNWLAALGALTAAIGLVVFLVSDFHAISQLQQNQTIDTVGTDGGWGLMGAGLGFVALARASHKMAKKRDGEIEWDRSKGPLENFNEGATVASGQSATVTSQRSAVVYLGDQPITDPA